MNLMYLFLFAMVTQILFLREMWFFHSNKNIIHSIFHKFIMNKSLV